MMPNHEKKRDYYVNQRLSQLKMNFNDKNGHKRSFSYETKASISLIPMRRMCLWCPIMKRKEIILWVHVYPIWNTNFNSKNGNKRSFSHKPKHNIINPNEENVFMIRNHENKGDYYVNPYLS